MTEFTTNDLYTKNGQIRKTTNFYRWQAIAVYGGECVRCGSFTNLEFDHVNADGPLHRAVESPAAMHKRILENCRKLPDWDLQLLCSQCHSKRTKIQRMIFRYGFG